MMGAEVRKRIIEARKRGITVKELSQCYGVSTRSIYELSALYRKTGSLAPLTHLRGSKPKINEETLQEIDQAIQKKPDITLEQLKETLQLPIGVSRLCQIVREKLGYTYKKKWYMQANKRESMYKSNANSGRKRLPG
ncbi:MAG: helix-turn-helix domain-containing protein [Akkermansia sp.]